MKTLTGKINVARIYTDHLEESAIEQIHTMLNNELVEGSHMAFMPDCHAGKGAVIGTTMTIKDKVCPNIVGVDIGCGMTVVKVDKAIDPLEIDRIIKEDTGISKIVRENPVDTLIGIRIPELHCYPELPDGIYNRAVSQIGTLGGGNHFIECNTNEAGECYLVIHSGSRNLGVSVANYYQQLAIHKMKTTATPNKSKEDVIRELKAAGRASEIANALKEYAKAQKARVINEDLAYLTGEDMQHYLDDMRIVQIYAQENRHQIAAQIAKALDVNIVESFDTIHNYIDAENMILRKGAISAQNGEKILIPMNMRDGSIICVGKGNPEWNYSAPHGAGRLLSRKQAKKSISLNEVLEDLKKAGVYTTTMVDDTIDEAPAAYKVADDIEKYIHDTCEIVERLKPFYNYKCTGMEE